MKYPFKNHCLILLLVLLFLYNCKKPPIEKNNGLYDPFNPNQEVIWDSATTYVNHTINILDEESVYKVLTIASPCILYVELIYEQSIFTKLEDDVDWLS